MKTAQESDRWSRVYDYDAYGNRWVQSANHTLTYATLTAASHFNAANNRITQNGNGQGTPPAYDVAGYLTNHLHIGAMAYDAENHQTSFTGASGTATHQYDGDGRRVKKLQGTRTTVVVYDAFGNLAAEYDTQPAPNLMAGTYYRTTDHLGSTRLVTNSTGAVVSRRDFFPFGEQINDTWGNRQLVKDGNTRRVPEFCSLRAQRSRRPGDISNLVRGRHHKQSWVGFVALYILEFCGMAAVGIHHDNRLREPQRYCLPPFRKCQL